MLELLQFEFAQNALIAGLLASIACALIGTFIVVNRMVSLSGAISHISFGGIGLGYFLGVDPILSAIPFSVSASLLIGWIQERFKQSTDTLIGMMWAMGMALGILFIHLSEGYAPDLLSYIFGNILTVSTDQLYLMGTLLLIIISSILLFYEKLKAVSFDEHFARASGINVFRYRLLLLGLTALSIILLIKLVGVILVIALLSIPAQIAKRFSSSLKHMLIYSTLISTTLTMSGILISFLTDLPSGASIVLLMGGVYLGTLLIPSRQ